MGNLRDPAGLIYTGVDEPFMALILIKYSLRTEFVRKASWNHITSALRQEINACQPKGNDSKERLLATANGSWFSEFSALVHPG